MGPVPPRNKDWKDGTGLMIWGENEARGDDLDEAGNVMRGDDSDVEEDVAVVQIFHAANYGDDALDSLLANLLSTIDPYAIQGKELDYTKLSRADWHRSSSG